MIYWLIPYLVAYNASSSGDWKYGPEHVFKAEVRSNVTTNSMLKMHSNIDMYISCRPMNSSLIQCAVESATIENFSLDSDDLKMPTDSDPPEKFEIGNVVFQVEFNDEGISKMWFLNTEGSYRLNMIRAIMGTIHLGVNLSEKKYASYTSMEKSIIGSCETTVDIGRKFQPGEEKLETVIDGYSFDVPAFKGRSKDEPIVIEKNRKMDKCSKKTPYFFGMDEDTEQDRQRGLKSETHVTSSQSRIYLGRKSFSAHTRNTGTLEYSSTREKGMRSLVNSDESIRFSLVFIRAAKEELRNTGSLAKIGAGFVAGVPWPERNDPKIKFFM